ncbi:MAG: hypothetical protein VXZ82_02845 [Planctomycetota bacterium]|nr:hypothetical protein [Planctomycetota bacterium]
MVLTIGGVVLAGAGRIPRLLGIPHDRGKVLVEDRENLYDSRIAYKTSDSLEVPNGEIYGVLLSIVNQAFFRSRVHSTQETATVTSAD